MYLPLQVVADQRAEVGAFRRRLTLRERDALKAMEQGKTSNKEISSAMGISERTAKFHMSSLMAKAGVHSRWELITFLDRQPCVEKPTEIRILNGAA